MKHYTFLHCADLHIGAGRKLLVDSADALVDTSYLLRYAYALYSISYIAKKHRCKVVIIAGDLFHSKHVTLMEVDLIRHWLSKLAEDHYVLITDGQHDTIKAIVGEPIRYTLLHHLKDLPSYGKKIVIADTEPKVFSLKGVSYLLVPFGFPITKDMVKSAGSPLVVAHHITLLGAIVESGLKLKSGETLPSFLLKKVSYLALGDIHKRQQIKPYPLFYPGSPLQHNFGDRGDCGVNIVSTKTFKPEFIKIHSRKLVTVSSVKEAKKHPNDIVRIVSSEAIESERIPIQVAKIELQPPQLDIKAATGKNNLLANVSKELKLMGANKKVRKIAVYELQQIVRDLFLSSSISVNLC